MARRARIDVGLQEDVSPPQGYYTVVSASGAKLTTSEGYKGRTEEEALRSAERGAAALLRALSDIAGDPDGRIRRRTRRRTP